MGRNRTVPWGRGARFAAATLTAATLLGTATVPAAAWPITLTAEDTTYLNAVRGVFPGDDNQLLVVGRQMCQQLYAGQTAAAVIDATAAQYGATPEQASVALSAARSTYCTQAPG